MSVYPLANVMTIMFKVETKCFGSTFWLDCTGGLVQCKRDREGQRRGREGQRWRKGSRQSWRDREGPILSDTDYRLCFLGGPEKMQCKWSVLHHGGFCFILALCVCVCMCVCVCVCVKGKWQRPLWVLGGLCSSSVLTWLEYVGRTAIVCPRPISKYNNRINTNVNVDKYECIHLSGKNILLQYRSLIGQQDVLI